MNAQEFLQLLVKLNACDEAKKWARGKSFQEVYAQCNRGDWLLWLLAKVKLDRKQVVYIAAQCARLALPFTTDPLVLACIEACEQWSRGEITERKLHQAAAAICVTAYAAYAAASAASAAYVAAASAADAAYAAEAAAADAARAAYVDAAYVDAADAVRTAILQQCANIVRKYVSLEQFESLLQE